MTAAAATSIAAAPSIPSTAPAKAGLVLASLILVEAVANLNLAVANVALPTIGEAFTASQTALDLVAVSYSLGLAASVLWLGAVGDRYGRKRMLLIGMALSIPACVVAGYFPRHGRERELLAEYHATDQAAAAGGAATAGGAAA
jgi:DHA2 family multidrug resistance protein-like MFS transporter